MPTLSALLLQAAGPLSRTAAAPLDAATVLLHGGWALVVLAAVLVWALVAAVGVARAAAASAGDGDSLLATVRDYIRAGNLVGALDFCRSQDSVAARVVSEGLARLGRPLGDIQTAVGAAAQREAARVRLRLDGLRSAALLGPAVGLLGTAAGGMQVLRRAAGPSAAGPSADALAGALWPVLVPAVAGAAVGIVAVALFHAVAGRAADAAAGLDTVAGDFVEMLRSPAEAG